MLRGVNKQIIEVKDTGNRYFERALLFVRPEFTQMRQGQLEQEADRYLTTVGRPPMIQPLPGQKAGRPAGSLSYAARMARVRRRRRLVGVAILSMGLLLFCLLWWLLG